MTEPWELLHTDALTGLGHIEPGTVDCVLTDPPYIIGIAAELEQIAIAAEVEGLGDWSADPIPRELLKLTAGVIIRIMKEEGIWA